MILCYICLDRSGPLMQNDAKRFPPANPSGEPLRELSFWLGGGNAVGLRRAPSEVGRSETSPVTVW